jgi:hypothetical protein
MKVELIISKDRVPYVVEGMGEGRVTVSPFNEDSDTVEFEFTSQMDLLFMFHAGIKCGTNVIINARQK